MHRTQAFEFEVDAFVIVIVDVVVDAALEFFNAIELVEAKVLGLQAAKKIFITALSSPVTFRDILCVTDRSANIRR